MHHLTMLVLIVSGIVLCMVDPSYSNACNCPCGHTYYCASADDCSKAPYGSKANPGLSCKDINTNHEKTKWHLLDQANGYDAINK